MIIVEKATPDCVELPALLLLLEELEAPYTLRCRAPGEWRGTRAAASGLRLLDGELTLFEAGAMLRYCARTHSPRTPPVSARRELELDAWLELSLRIGRSLAVLEREERESEGERRPTRISEERARLSELIDEVERALMESDGDWLLDDFGLADCTLAVLPRVALWLDFARWPRVLAYCDRFATRPSERRVRERLRGQPAPAEEVLEFWFGRPALTDQQLQQKSRRMFAGGAAMDAQVKERFARTVEQAFSGELDAWAESAQGRLALVIVLDQLTRHVFRNDPLAYAGDSLAQRLALEAFERGIDATLSTHERMFLSMPLLHAEDPRCLERAGQVARLIARDAPPLFARACAMHEEQAQKYLGVVRRFGRFPHRNRILGRDSSADELAFLEDWAEKGPPKGALRER